MPISDHEVRRHPLWRAELSNPVAPRSARRLVTRNQLAITALVVVGALAGFAILVLTRR
jgi:hypothetical protein